MKCYNVKCLDVNGVEHDVGVMTTSMENAMNSAIKSLKEGKHVDTAKILECNIVEAI